MQLTDMADVESARPHLVAVVKAWCQLRSDKPAARKKPAAAVKKKKRS